MGRSQQVKLVRRHKYYMRWRTSKNIVELHVKNKLHKQGSTGRLMQVETTPLQMNPMSTSLNVEQPREPLLRSVSPLS